MKKLIKITFFALLVLVGLYFFGDFRINDTNVKVYLHKKITVANMIQVRNKVVTVYHKLVQVFSDDANVTDSKVFKSAQEKSTQTENKHDVSKDFATNPLDKLTTKDQKKLLQLLESEVKKEK